MCLASRPEPEHRPGCLAGCFSVLRFIGSCRLWINLHELLQREQHLQFLVGQPVQAELHRVHIVECQSAFFHPTARCRAAARRSLTACCCAASSVSPLRICKQRAGIALVPFFALVGTWIIGSGGSPGTVVAQRSRCLARRFIGNNRRIVFNPHERSSACWIRGVKSISVV